MSLADLRKKSLGSYVNSIVEKSKKLNKPKSTIRKANSLYEKIKSLCEVVESRLANYANDFECITEESRLTEYISKAIQNGYITIDTETTGLDPITDELVGACIYTPTEKPAYIPVNHKSLITGVRLTNQLTNNIVAKEFKRLIDDNVKVIYFNAKFDIRVMRHQLGVDIPAYWDCFLAAKVLKENEEEANLKYLWKKYCSENKDEAHFTFDKMFEGYKFDIIPIKTAYLYAAKDALMTWELFKFQEPYLTSENELCKKYGFEKLSKVFKDIEMPIVSLVADIEDAGVAINVNYCKQLSEKYHKLLEEKTNKFNAVLSNYKDKITAYKNTHPNSKLEDPINISSPVQLAELIYDVLQIPLVSRKQPRGTGEEILLKINHPICEAILECREVNKLLTTYIDKMPEIRNKKTGRIHCNFRQYGTDTGRFACSDPNLQNIPAHNKEIRRLFVASKSAIVKSIDKQLILFPYDLITTVIGTKFAQDLQINDTIASNKSAYITNVQINATNIKLTLDEDIEIKIGRIYIFIGADYSQQEPKLTADLSNDEKFIAECAAGKDAYGTVASLAFNKPYEDCLEFYLDASGNKTDVINKEGKERRSQAKSILLGICYGRSIKTIAEQLNCEEDKAQQIYNAVVNGIAGLRMLTQDSEEMARQYGWVETKWGRRRHIPHMQLPPYEVISTGTQNFDPFFDSEELGVVNDIDRIKQSYIQEMHNARGYKQKQSIKDRAKKEGLDIRDNTRFIEEAKRQCVNSRIQGSAADQTKIAIRNLGGCQELKDLGWRTLLLIHDEIIGECPLIFAKRCGELLSQCMIDAAKDLRTGAKCDATYVFAWYDDQFDKQIAVDIMSTQELEDLVVKCIKENS